MKIEEIFGNLPNLETKRLILRKVTPDDARDMFEYASDPEVTRYLTWEPHRSIEDSINYLKSVVQRYEKKEVSEWGIVYRENNKFIGTCGYMKLLPAHARAEMAYALSREYWNKGIMTEAVKEVIRFGFEEMKLNRIEATCMVRNVASQRVMEKCGMSFEGIIRDAMFCKGSYHDLKLYSILKREWKK